TNSASFWRAGATRKRNDPARRKPLDSEKQGHIMPCKSPQTPRWRNWQTHYFEVVAPQGVQLQILSWASKKCRSRAGLAAFSFLSSAHIDTTCSSSQNRHRIGRQHVRISIGDRHAGQACGSDGG